ncbi:MAG TPA: hypothetical protein ENJ07_02680 [Gammaproteobacteria bacterium]|nr:hypothetical protein [Gammaproteobacteria bacterium]
MKPMLIIFGITIAALFSNYAVAEESDFRVLEYDVLLEGEDAGDITLKLVQTEEGYLIVEHNQIKVPGWWGDINITTILSEEFQHGSGFINSDSKTVADGTAYWSRISRRDDGYLGAYTEISKIDQHETQQFSRLSSALTGRDQFKAEEIIARSRTIFSARAESAHTHRVKFTQNAFSTTLYDFPFFIQRRAGKPLPKKINILDAQGMEVHQVSISDLGVEILLVGKEKLQVRHLLISGGKYKPSHLWLKEAGTSFPYIIRHVGEDEDGMFEIILKAD